MDYKILFIVGVVVVFILQQFLIKQRTLDSRKRGLMIAAELLGTDKIQKDGFGYVCVKGEYQGQRITVQAVSLFLGGNRPSQFNFYLEPKVPITQKTDFFASSDPSVRTFTRGNRIYFNPRYGNSFVYGNTNAYSKSDFKFVFDQLIAAAAEQR